MAWHWCNLQTIISACTHTFGEDLDIWIAECEQQYSWTAELSDLFVMQRCLLHPAQHMCLHELRGQGMTIGADGPLGTGGCTWLLLGMSHKYSGLPSRVQLQWKTAPTCSDLSGNMTL